MKNNRFSGIIALTLVTVLAFGVIVGTKVLTKDSNKDGDTQSPTTSAKLESIDVASYKEEGIKEANKLIGEDGTVTGFEVVSFAKGYHGNVTIKTTFDAEGKVVTSVEVLEQTETDGLGSKIIEADFLGQFTNAAIPVFMDGAQVDVPVIDNNVDTKTLADGTYKATGEEYNDYTSNVEVVVKDGAIISVVWDALDKDGNSKRVLSKEGKYVMTEDGLTWEEQADALAKKVIEDQSLEDIKLNDEGKTDSVSGVSINIYDFVNLVTDCLKQASPITLKDGTYEATGEESNGYTGSVVTEIKDGAIKSVTWDAVDADGNTKRVLSAEGKYVMTEDGPTWAEQADALAKKVITDQSLEGIKLNDEGKTDSVSGVSINIYEFVNLVTDTLNQASGTITDEKIEQAETEETVTEGTKIDGVSGATFSSKAVIDGINKAATFIADYVIG